ALGHLDRQPINGRLAPVALDQPLDPDHRPHMCHAAPPSTGSFFLVLAPQPPPTRPVGFASPRDPGAIVRTDRPGPLPAEDRLDLGRVHLALPGLLDRT